MRYMVTLDSVYGYATGLTERLLSTLTYDEGSVSDLVEASKRLSESQKAMHSELLVIDWSVCEVVSDRGLELRGIDVTGCDAICVGAYGFDSVRMADGREDVITYKITKRFALAEVGGSNFSNDEIARVMPNSDDGNRLTEVYGYVVRELESGTVSFV